MMVKTNQCFFLLSLLTFTAGFLPQPIKSTDRRISSPSLQSSSRIAASCVDDQYAILPQLSNKTATTTATATAKESFSTSSSSSRRYFVGNAIVTCTAAAALFVSPPLKALAAVPANNTNPYKPAIRPLVYLVDSTIPPTLLSMTEKQAKGILTELGRGSGTNKEAIVVDTVNINNILNKILVATINMVSSNQNMSRSGSGLISFCCLAMPSKPQPKDVELALEIMQTMVSSSLKSGGTTGLGLYFCPYATQTALNQYVKGEIDDSMLSDILFDAGVSMETQDLYRPILLWAAAARGGVDLIAMAPEVEDMITVRRKGLQYVNPERRSQYVVDAEGFIALTQDKRYNLYTERSLSKDYEPIDDDKEDSFANFYAQRIMAHEAGATALAQYASSHAPLGSSSFVMALAPVADFRYLNGINGRLPRVCRYFNPDSAVTDKFVTTILLNPTASDTLSLTRRLRLEIGTAPETLEYQTKVADYLWFSSSPKVNLITRLMN